MCVCVCLCVFVCVCVCVCLCVFVCVFPVHASCPAWGHHGARVSALWVVPYRRAEGSAREQMVVSMQGVYRHSGSGHPRQRAWLSPGGGENRQKAEEGTFFTPIWIQNQSQKKQQQKTFTLQTQLCMLTAQDTK